MKATPTETAKGFAVRIKHQDGRLCLAGGVDLFYSYSRARIFRDELAKELSRHGSKFKFRIVRVAVVSTWQEPTRATKGARP